jgi:hypothetical protein
VLRLILQLKEKQKPNSYCKQSPSETTMYIQSSLYNDTVS